MTPADAAPAAPRRRLPAHLKITGALGVVILIGALVAGHTKYAALAPAPYVAWLLWRHTAARLAFVSLGGLFVLGSGVDHLTLTKVAYFAGVGLAVVAILRKRELYRDLRDPTTTARALAPVTLALGVIIVVSLPVAHTEHTTFSAWLRDASAYGLLALAPFFIWDAARPETAFARIARPLLFTLAALSGLSLIVQWLERRHVTSFSIDSHVMPGAALPAAAAFLLVADASSDRPRQARWMALALAIPVALFLGGTRNALVLFIGVAAATFVQSEHRRELVGWALALCAVVAVALGLLIALGHAGHPGVERLTKRFTSIPHTILHPNSDGSYRLRAGEWHVAWETFKSHPLLGVGPGHIFVWKYGYGGIATRSGYNLDSPLVYVAKFGALGLAALVALALALIRFVRLRLAAPTHRAATALAWYLAFGVLSLPFGMPLEAKDFTLGLIILGGFAARDSVPTFDPTRFWRKRTRPQRRGGLAMEPVDENKSLTAVRRSNAA